MSRLRAILPSVRPTSVNMKGTGPLKSTRLYGNLSKIEKATRA